MFTNKTKYVTSHMSKEIIKMLTWARHFISDYYLVTFTPRAGSLLSENLLLVKKADEYRQYKKTKV